MNKFAKRGVSALVLMGMAANVSGCTKKKRKLI